MKIVVLGSTGMLGSAVAQYMIERYGRDNIWLSFRANGGKNEQLLFKILGASHGFVFDPLVDKCTGVPIVDVVINCIGVIKPFVKQVGDANTLAINSVFPHRLADYCVEHGAKLIHITTDCVYSGAKGQYVESDVHDCDDVYGRSKSLGEPSTNAMVLRTSIIGEEIHNKVSLIEWTKSQKDKEVKGYTNSFWNGVTTKTYAQVIASIIDGDLYQTGLFHVFSPQTINKFELLQMLDQKFNLNLKITPTEDIKRIDRSLSTSKQLCKNLCIPVLNEQIEKM
jgi:dTDP-4-dehydrorhamnose reductase